MLRAWVEKRSSGFVVFSGKITQWGFQNVRKTDTFRTLERANKKADIANYIFQKASEYCQTRQVANG